MEFSVEFYRSTNGKSPVRDFLDELERTNPNDYGIVIAGLGKLRIRQYHRAPFSKTIGDGLMELRHVGKLNTRVIYFFMAGRRIVLVHGIRNKDRAIPVRDREVALSRMKDWIQRTQ